jgi:hypothetical protein
LRNLRRDRQREANLVLLPCPGRGGIPSQIVLLRAQENTSRKTSGPYLSVSSSHLVGLARVAKQLGGEEAEVSRASCD